MAACSFSPDHLALVPGAFPFHFYLRALERAALASLAEQWPCWEGLVGGLWAIAELANDKQMFLALG